MEKWGESKADKEGYIYIYPSLDASCKTSIRVRYMITHATYLSLSLLAKLEYEKETFFENVLFNLRVRTIREMSQLDERVNRSLWTATPAVVNAYYSRNRNQISELIMVSQGIL